MKLKNLSLLLICIYINQLHAETFTDAKKRLYIKYRDKPVTFYCQCKYDKYKRIDLKQCGYQVRKNKRRALRVEAEHIVPASVFGQSRACWREKLCVKKNGKRYGGRKCCQKIDPVYRAMENDINNLVPAVGEVNGDRSNFTFTELGEQPYQYGACEMLVDFKSKRVQPPAHTRAKIARTYFYMNKKYGVPISDKQRRLFTIWVNE